MRLRLYEVVLRLPHYTDARGRLRTVSVHATTNDDAIAAARRAVGESWCRRCRVVAIRPGYEPDDFADVGASPLEPKPHIGARAYAQRRKPPKVRAAAA